MTFNHCKLAAKLRICNELVTGFAPFHHTNGQIIIHNNLQLFSYDTIRIYIIYPVLTKYIYLCAKIIDKPMRKKTFTGYCAVINGIQSANIYTDLKDVCGELDVKYIRASRDKIRLFPGGKEIREFTVHRSNRTGDERRFKDGWAEYAKELKKTGTKQLMTEEEVKMEQYRLDASMDDEV